VRALFVLWGGEGDVRALCDFGEIKVDVRALCEGGEVKEMCVHCLMVMR